MTRHVNGTFALCAAALVIAAPGFAQTSSAPAPNPRAAQPERPTVATHAGTVAPGFLEIEAGVEFDKYRDSRNGALVPAVFKIGLAKQVQLSIQAPVVRPAGGNSTGAGDMSVGVKWRILDNAPLLGDFAVFPSIKFATGSAKTGTGTGTTDVGFLLISSHQVGRVAVDLNAGITRRSGDGSDVPRTSTVWTASFGGPSAGSLGWCAEVFGFPATSGAAGADAIVAVLAGPTWTVRDSLVLDAGVIVRLTGDQPRAIYAGLTWNVGGLR